MKRLAFMACVAAGGVSLNAGTVVHYTFDSGNVGDVLADASTIVNVANPGVHDATVYGLNTTTLLPSSSLMPCYTNGIPGNYRIYDPVVGSLAATPDRALRFRAANINGKTGILQIENDAALRPEAFTVEALVRYPAGMEIPGWNVIAVHPAIMKCANADAWGIRITGKNQITARFAQPQTYTLKSGKTDEYENASASMLVSVSAIVPALNDGRWHHVAFTAKPSDTDSSKTDVKVFFDYEQKASATLSFRPQFTDAANCPVWVGANRQTAGHFMGEIGEFRFSDEALPALRFLRLRAKAYDPDVVLHYTFDEAMWFGSGAVQNVVDPTLMNGALSTNMVEGVGAVPCVVNDSPFAEMCLSKGTDSFWASSNSLMNAYASADARMTDAYLYANPTEDWFSERDFTIECFYKSNGDIEQYTPFVSRPGGVNMQFNLGVGDNKNRLYCIVSPEGVTNNAQSVKITDPAGTADGKWHHAAVVVRQKESIKLYRDWSAQPVAQAALSTNLPPRSVTESYSSIYIAGGRTLPGGRRNTFNGRLDEVRITLRALEPDEFIHPFVPRGVVIIFK